MILEPGDCERLVERPNPGRALWVVGSERRLRNLAGGVDDDLWPSLLRSADRVIESSDGWMLVRVTLPRRGA